MANLTNSGKLIAKIEDIDSKIGSIPAGTDIAQEISDVQDSIGNVPAGSTVMDEIDDINDKIGTLPEGKTAAQAIADAASAASDAAGAAAAVASDLSDFESEVADTYATKDSVASAFLYKGTKATYAELPASGNKTGDVWNITTADPTHDVKAGDNVVWNGEAWDVLAGIVDLSNYYTKAQVDAAINAGGEATSALADRVSDLETDNTTNKTNISNLQTAVQTAEGDIDSLETRMGTAETDIEAVSGDVTALQGQMTTANSNISTLQGNVSTLQDDVSDIQTEMANNLPFEAFYMDVVLNGVTTTVSNSKLTATSQVSFVVKSGTLNGYYLEREVAAGSATFKSNVAESATLEVLVINKKTA